MTKTRKKTETSAKPTPKTTSMTTPKKTAQPNPKKSAKPAPKTTAKLYPKPYSYPNRKTKAERDPFARPAHAVKVPIQLANDDNVKQFGHLFDDWDTEPCELTPWPQPGYRPVEDGVGGGHTSGTFTLDWKNGAHYATNSGVKDGSYCFAFSTLAGAVNGKSNKSSTKAPDRCFCTTEINYHACGA